MALRRELSRAALLAATLLLLLPAAAMGFPQWLDGEPLQASAAPESPPRVAADDNGGAVAVWLGAGGEVDAAFRPRGGPWGAAENLETEFPVSTVAPRVVALPDGGFVAVWIADPDGEGDDVLRSATHSTSGEWSPPETVDTISCCPGITALAASADGSVTVISTDEGIPRSNTRAPDTGTWGASEPVRTGSGTQVAVAPDGSAVAANRGSCDEVDCIRAAYRPPGGPWGASEPVALTGFDNVSGLAVAAGPDSSYTVVWTENTVSGQVTEPPGAVRASDRAAGAGGAWDEAPTLLADLPTESPGCPGFSFGCVDLASGANGAQVAVWQQTGSFGDRIGAKLRTLAEGWQPGAELAGETGASATAVAAGITTEGHFVAAWAADSPGSAAVARGSLAVAPGIWFPVALGPPVTGSVDLDDLAVDGDGNAVTAWTDPSGASAAGFDGGAPRFSSFAVPATGTAGETLTFSATAEDNWSGVAGISWLFGDGGTASGGTVGHAYGGAGSFSATATATDGVGNVAQSTGSTAVAAAPTPPPDPCGTTDQDKDGIKDGCDDNNGAARPVPFKTVNATVVSGDVFVKLPAGAARASQAKPPKGFVRLEGAETIPVRSILDTSKGRVRLRTAADTRNHVQTADFFRGRFVVRQVRKPRGKARRRSNKLITDTILNGSSFRRACRATTASISQRRRRSRKRVRRLFGDGKGTFRTRGRNAAATVRGTRWSVQDRCDGTLVTVQRGRVSVRDLVKRKTVTVRTGNTYLARRR
jgi:hypothetical protein